MSRESVVAIVALLLVLVAPCLRAAEQSSPPGRIAFESLADGDLEIYVMDPDGGNPEGAPEGATITLKERSITSTHTGPARSASCFWEDWEDLPPAPRRAKSRRRTTEAPMVLSRDTPRRSSSAARTGWVARLRLR